MFFGRSVQPEGFLGAGEVDLWLFSFEHHEWANDERIHVGSHEALVGVCR